MKATLARTTDNPVAQKRLARLPAAAVALVIMSLVISANPPAAAAQSVDARQALEELAAAMKGSAATTRRRALEEFRRNFEGKIVRFSGTLWNLSSLALDRDKEEAREIGPALYSWEFQGIQAKGGGQSGAPADDMPNQRAKTRLGGADQATLIIVRSGKYQLYALTASPEVVDGLKQGTEITLDVQLSGLLEESLFGFVTTVSFDDSIPRCGNGHQLPAGNDFTFCPYCGESLK